MKKGNCQHDGSTYIDIVGRVELTKCSQCDEILRRQNVGDLDD